MVTQVTLLGRAAIYTQGERLEPPFGKLTALLYYVAYQGGWVSRDDLIYLFYPDLEEHKARQNLRPLLTKLRRLPWAAGLEVEPTRLRWNVPTDVRAFKDAVEKGHLEEAVGHYRGELLGGFRLSAAPEFDTWLEVERGELQRSWRNVMVALTEELTSQGCHRQAADLLHRLFRANPLDETVFRRYFTALASAGRKSEALEVFEAFRKVLDGEVAGEPEPATQDLVARLHSGDLAVAGPVPTLAVTRPKPNRPTTRFVGRTTEVAEVVAHLQEPACRLLSVLGPGGIGKTRLAAEVGGVLSAEFADGVFFVPFDVVAAPTLMVPTLADALHFTFVAGRDPEDQLLEHLAPQNLLLVMDNLEHLLEGVSLVTNLLQAAPRLKILATSRERLGLHAEWVYDLAGMRVPDVGSSEEDADFEQADAVELFVQTAKKARADFALNGDVAIVAHICRTLGGMPLAIELAASWLRVLSPAEVAAELAKGIDLLETSLRDLPERHHDLRAVFGASWRRLAEGEQTALKKLAVFQGGFTKEAALAVAAASLPLLLGLVNKSFLFGGRGRFGQHPLVKQYLLDKAALEPESFTQTRADHAAYFAAFMQRREAAHQGMTAKTVHAEIVPELPNVRAAWFYAVANGREDVLDAMSEGVLEVYTSAGRHEEAEELFAHATELQTRSLVRGRVLRNLGHVHNWQLEYAKAAELLNASIAIFQEHRAKHDEAVALGYLTINYSFSSRPSYEVQRLREAAAVLFRELGDKNNEARQLSNLAEYYPDPERRERSFREAVRLFREVDGYFGITLTLCNLAFSQATTWGAYREAESLIAEAVRIERERGMAFRLAWWLNCQGDNDLCQGHLEAAESHFDEARRIGETLEPGFGMWELEKAVAGLGRLAYLRGDNAGARGLFTRALELNTRHADPMDVKKNILLGFSKLAFSEHAHAEAEDLCRQTGFDKPNFYELAYYVWEEVGYLRQLGAVAAARAEAETANSHFQRALDLVRKWHFLPAALQLCADFADLARRQGDERRAARLFKLAADHPASLFETKEAAKRGLETLPATVVTAEARGEAVGLEQVVESLLRAG